MFLGHLSHRLQEALILCITLVSVLHREKSCDMLNLAEPCCVSTLDEESLNHFFLLVTKRISICEWKELV